LATARESGKSAPSFYVLTSGAFPQLTSNKFLLV